MRIFALFCLLLSGPLFAQSTRATLTGSAPPWASSSSFKSGAAATDFVTFRVYLGWQNPAGLESLVRAVSDPSSASYRQYLTPAQFHARFAPAQANVTAVQQWLRDQGFTVIYTPGNNHYVAAEGTIAQAATAFGVSFGVYSVQGLGLRAPASDITLPSSIAGFVTGVIGLDQTPQLVHTHSVTKDPDAPPTPAFVNAQPCSAYWGEKLATGFPNPYGKGALPYGPCGYTPAQMKGAYGMPASFDGSGQTVAIIDAFASPTIQQDLDTWSAARGIPSTKLTQIVAPGTYNHPEAGLKQDPQGWYGEETLDIEAVHGMAPGASIVYVGAANSFQDLDAALNHVVDKHLAQIVTNSYGFSTELLAPGFIKPYEDTMLQGAAQGIGIYFSSGDDSDESQVVGYITADWPASSPYVTAVGGTSLAVGASNDYLFETGWGTSRSRWSTSCTGSYAWCPAAPGTWVYGSGGGVSVLFAEPWYQQGVVPGSVFSAQGRTGRALPDISTNADPTTGFLIGQTQQFPDGSTRYSEYRIGGTSLSSPIFAGIMAVADQASGTPHGFANPALYQLAGTSAIRDVVAPQSTVAAVRVDYQDFVSTLPLRYTLRTFDQTLSLKTARGWDDVTGLGTPAPGFIDALR
jgi:subtilase family serine protease